jgi:hypothetical protein
MQKLERMYLLCAAMVLACVSSQAQQPARSEGPVHAPVELALTYAGIHAAHTTDAQPAFWLQGGAIELHAPLYRGLGIVASVTGATVENTGPAIAPLSLVTVVFGPRYTYTAGALHHRLSMFGEGLVGEGHGFYSVFATGSGPVSNPSNGTTDSANSLAVQTGGGLDIRISRSVGIRAIQADYLRTQLPNGGTNAQNNLRLAAGVVVMFGRSRY